ncbi:GNAT family N-acetyltransferase [Nonomuraea africana]|uniref:GNAT superfamily N-acetyltransferase n=1 Tax=Nonomuraea africana TaxID=46171 RepID=A0ABR9KCI1_9ACTN|nr:GNAT family N-acetyltransferase [Nonomuraea africana]MBE1559511.1 GNAT superfamily N-acetyltransferase [Nonomuraea africana]
MPYKIHIAPVFWMPAERAAAWHAVVAASIGHDLPGEPPPTPKQVHARLTTAGPDGRRLFWLATEDDGAVVGVAGLRLLTEPGRDHLAELELHVHPARRRRGVGGHLLATAVFAAQVERRRGLLTSAVADGPGAAFCGARGFRRRLTLHHLLLDVARADGSAADAGRPGYELTAWTGAVPDHLAEALAAARNAVRDGPPGEADDERRTWDADRVRTMAKALADGGDTLLTVAALAKERPIANGLAGYTELVIRAGETRRALQYDTAVVPAHRGRGLGSWLKAAMVRRLRAEHPGVTEIESVNAENNARMLAVNRRLGFRPCHRTHEYRLDVTP